MKKKLSILLIALVGCVVAVSAQGRRGLRINEVMVQNDSNYVDDYGLHHAWIELYNSTYAPMEISSVYLSNDPAQPKKYPVPLGDVNTEIPPRQHVVFWADGEPNKGTFHLSFKLVPGQDNWIGIYDANGVTLIDSITVPASLGANSSYARIKDGEGEGAEAWSVRDGSSEAYITPSSNNKIIDTNSKVEMFGRDRRSRLRTHPHGNVHSILGTSAVEPVVLCHQPHRCQHLYPQQSSLTGHRDQVNAERRPSQT